MVYSNSYLLDYGHRQSSSKACCQLTNIDYFWFCVLYWTVHNIFLHVLSACLWLKSISLVGCWSKIISHWKHCLFIIVLQAIGSQFFFAFLFPDLLFFFVCHIHLSEVILRICSKSLHSFWSEICFVRLLALVRGAKALQFKSRNARSKWRVLLDPSVAHRWTNFYLHFRFFCLEFAQNIFASGSLASGRPTLLCVCCQCSRCNLIVHYSRCTVYACELFLCCADPSTEQPFNDHLNQ